MTRRIALTITFSATIAVIAFIACLAVGTVDIPLQDVVDALLGKEVEREVWRVIVIESRLPMAVSACVACAALSVAGLLLQTTFDNPLAGPSILGVSTGASLGVAIVMLFSGGIVSSLGAYWSTLGGALIGAMAVIGVLLVMSRIVRSAAMLLIVGVLIGYLASSCISLLNFFAERDSSVRAFVSWGFGSFSNVGLSRLPGFVIPALGVTLLSLLYAKPLDALLLGERYARSLGFDVKRVHFAILLLSGILTAVATAFCGPIGFIGLIVPHIARLATGSSTHRILIPATIICGAAIGEVCALLSVLPTIGIMPINAITPIIGVPIILYIILFRRRIAYLA